MHTKLINFELEVEVINPYLLTQQEVKDMLDEGDDATDDDPLQGVDNV